MFDDRTCFGKADVGADENTERHEAIYNDAVNSSTSHSLVRKPWLFIAVEILINEMICG